MQRIEICGNIASGKTTLAKAFQSNGYSIINENFQSIAFLDDFYRNPQSFSFETELAFTLQHYYQIKKQENFSICDFSLITDYAFALTTLKNSEMRAYNEVFTIIINNVGMPKRIIRLITSNEEQLNRIKKRKRNNELLITKEYLAHVDNNIEYALKNLFCKTQIVTINTDIINSTQYEKSFIENLIEIR